MLLAVVWAQIREALFGFRLPTQALLDSSRLTGYCQDGEW